MPLRTTFLEFIKRLVAIIFSLKLSGFDASPPLRSTYCIIFFFFFFFVFFFLLSLSFPCKASLPTSLSYSETSLFTKSCNLPSTGFCTRHSAQPHCDVLLPSRSGGVKRLTLPMAQFPAARPWRAVSQLAMEAASFFVEKCNATRQDIAPSSALLNLSKRWIGLLAGG